MHLHTRPLGAWVLASMLSVPFSGGCDSVAWIRPSLAPGVNLPPGITAVYDNNVYFDEARSSKLAEVSAGTANDELSALDGCWGAYRVGDMGIASTLGLDFDHRMYQFYAFDIGAGTAEYQSYMTSPFGRFGMAHRSTYDLEVSGPGAIHLIETSFSAMSPETLALEPCDACGYCEGWDMPREACDSPPEPEPVAVAVTVDGDEMKIGPGAADTDAVSVFRRFDCP